MSQLPTRTILEIDKDKEPILIYQNGGEHHFTFDLVFIKGKPFIRTTCADGAVDYYDFYVIKSTIASLDRSIKASSK